MRARLVVFPIKGRNWCFSRSIEPASAESAQPSSMPADAWRQLWGKLFTRGDLKTTGKEKVELVIDFAADKMNGAWLNLEKAPVGSVKSKIHRVGLKLLSRVKPSETFLRSVSEDITKVEITYPSSLNPRLVRRRLRHIARRGSVNHRIFFYGSVSLVPFTAALSVLPLPNIPFFWLLFRAFANWRALKGSERLLLLVSDCPNELKSMDGASEPEPWTLQPCDKLEELIGEQPAPGEERDRVLRKICEIYRLDETEVLRFSNNFSS